MQSNNETPMIVDVDETDSTFIQTPNMNPQQLPPQSSAYNLLASMIAGSDTSSLLPNANPGLILPLTSPSPTLTNMLQTPSPSASNFPFVFQPNQSKGNEPFSMDISAPNKDVGQQPPPAKPPPIKLKFKKVASNYIIETPKDNKLEPSPVIDNTPATTQFTVPFDTGAFTPDSSDMLSTFQQNTNVEQLISSASHDPPIDLLPSGTVSFTDVDSTAFLPGAASANIAGTSRISDVDGIFQTLPGGATNSPSGLDVEDAYGFDTTLGGHSLILTGFITVIAII